MSVVGVGLGLGFGLDSAGLVNIHVTQATVHCQLNNINDKSFEHAASGRNTSYARFFLYKTTSYSRKRFGRQ